MSIRSFATIPIKQHVGGSLFGPAIGTPPGGFWSSLAVSPPRSPPHDLAMLAPPSFSLDDADTSFPHGVTIEGVCPTSAFDFGGHVALVVFEHDLGNTITLQSHPRRVGCADPVLARPVEVDSISAQPMMHDQHTGYVFHLCFRGTCVCRVEVVASQPNVRPVLERVAVVQSSFSPMAVEAGLVDRSSMLVYDRPSSHLQTLTRLKTAMTSDPELCYVPTSECCVTARLDALHLDTDDFTARRVWYCTRQFLGSMSKISADCTDLHATREIERVQASELRDRVSQWRSHVC